MEKSRAFVDVRNISVEYPINYSVLGKLIGRTQTTHAALRNVRFQLAAGMHVTLYGAPGAGKTTLLRVLAGAVKISRGIVRINGQSPVGQRHLAAGYVSSQESEPDKDTVSEILHAFGRTHDIANLPARIGAVSEAVNLAPLMYRPAHTLSTTERLALNLARAALSEAPLILLDDVADLIGPFETRRLLDAAFTGRTTIVATRFTKTAEALGLPILLLHRGSLTHYGTCDEIANDLACQRVVDVWVEGLRYDLLRALRRHPGIVDVRLLPADSLAGQRLRITLQSSRYLPSLYDLVSQAPLVRVQELPASLADIIARL